VRTRPLSKEANDREHGMRAPNNDRWRWPRGHLVCSYAFHASVVKDAQRGDRLPMSAPSRETPPQGRGWSKRHQATRVDGVRGVNATTGVWSSSISATALLCHSGFPLSRGFLTNFYPHGGNWRKESNATVVHVQMFHQDCYHGMKCARAIYIGH